GRGVENKVGCSGGGKEDEGQEVGKKEHITPVEK
ncbi:unnamed protein product, partial [marine sediment metagenome]